MFGIFGLVLCGWGLVTRGSDIYQRSLGYNVNLEWGLVLLVFGAVMLYFGQRGRKKKA
jgi:hypothetical protein